MDRSKFCGRLSAEVWIIKFGQWRIQNHHRSVFGERQGKDFLKKIVPRSLKDAHTTTSFNKQLLTQAGNKHREGVTGDDMREGRKDLRR